MILSDFDLRAYIESGRLKVKPLSKDIIRENGLDLRVGDQIARFRRMKAVVDVHQTTNLSCFFKIEKGEEFILEPYEHVLISTIEYLELPNDLMGFVQLRSTFARLGVIIPPTIVDAGFKGQLTLEVKNGPLPLKLRRGQRFAHIIFAKLLNPVEKPYRGKYFGQRGVTLPIPDSSP